MLIRRNFTRFLNVVLIGFICCVFGTDNSVVYGQNVASAKRSLKSDSTTKPELNYFVVRLNGDMGISLIDLDGNVLSRNFAPVINSYGTVRGGNRMGPVINGLFCVKREKEVDGKWRSSMTVYRNPKNPTPVPGLTDIYQANIINPDLFPICKHGERIKFVDGEGNVKFTVMPIDGREPYSVSPYITNGLFIAKVAAKPRPDGRIGAIDINGNWKIYPEWDNLKAILEGRFIGYKDGKQYIIDPNGKTIENPNPNIDCIGDYYVETIHDNGRFVSNIYDSEMKYLTTLDNADYIRTNTLHPNILLIRQDFANGYDVCYEILVDLNKNNKPISRKYHWMQQLPDGNYFGSDRNGKKWYVKIDGTATPLPDKTDFTLRHPTMVTLYNSKINRFIVRAKDGVPGYICDFSGNRVGTIQLEEFYNSDWEAEPVKSSYCLKYVYGKE